MRLDKIGGEALDGIAVAAVGSPEDTEPGVRVTAVSAPEIEVDTELEGTLVEGLVGETDVCAKDDDGNVAGADEGDAVLDRLSITVLGGPEDTEPEVRVTAVSPPELEADMNLEDTPARGPVGETDVCAKEDEGKVAEAEEVDATNATQVRVGTPRTKTV